MRIKYVNGTPGHSLTADGLSANERAFCRNGFHEATALLVDALDEEDRVHRCGRCGAQFTPVPLPDELSDEVFA